MCCQRQGAPGILVLDDDVEVNCEGNGLVVERGRGKAELADGGNHTGIQVGANGLDHLDVAGIALFIDVHLQPNFGIGGNHRIEGVGGNVDVRGRGEPGLREQRRSRAGLRLPMR